MNLTISLDENDYLTHQLLIASHSERIRKKRVRSKIVTPLIYLTIGGLFLGQGRTAMGLALMVLGILWFFFYPAWERRRYYNHYRGFIREHYTERFGKTATLEIDADFITARDQGSEGRVATSEIDGIQEIPTLILVRIKGGQSFILPKNYLPAIDELKHLLQQIAAKQQIPYHTYNDWKWS